jgi:2-polyprenyl-3-methyl-5-hydroxy-6-metoxy-1,4-benzoquinol methylase
MSQDLTELKQAEAEFWDRSADRRTADGRIPMEADIRRATRSFPRAPGELLIDPRMTQMLEGAHRDHFIALAAHAPGGRVLDIGCGPGWLALELARHGQTVDAYDLSPSAIAVARRMLAENPYTEGFGGVTYHVRDVTEVDLGIERYDAVTGNSSFHHINDLRQFMDRLYAALKPGAIVVAIDDMPRGPLELGLERFLRLVLPTYDRSYASKVAHAVRRVLGVARAPEEIHSPMEGKGPAVEEISRIWHEKFEVIKEERFMAFSLGPAMSVRGPDAFRYGVARVIIWLDRMLCRAGVTQGFIRVLIGRKPQSGSPFAR